METNWYKSLNVIAVNLLAVKSKLFMGKRFTTVGGFIHLGTSTNPTNGGDVT